MGGWQVAGIGNTRQGYWSLPTNYYPTGNPIEIYGFKYPIQDCQSGTCFPGYLWWNGYIPANRINSVDANGKPNGIMGVPSNYKPATAPLIPWGQTALPPNAPAGTNVSGFWDTNSVWIPLNNGTVQRDRLQRQPESVAQPVHAGPVAVVPGCVGVQVHPDQGAGGAAVQR